MLGVRRAIQVRNGIFIGAIVALSATAGCHRGAGGAADPSGISFVPISYEDYRPEFGTALGAFKGKKVRLLDFVNHAEDTSQSSYSNPDKSITYGNPHSGFAGIGGRPLESYFWYCFQKAFEVIGMSVSTSSESAQQGVPSIQVTLKSVTDAQYTVQVEVQRLGAPSIAKPITISEPPMVGAAKTEAGLTARAYKMMTATVQAVLSDPDVAKAITEGK
jgi:hypothetical protein